MGIAELFELMFSNGPHTNDDDDVHVITQF